MEKDNGAEICELVGIYILSRLSTVIDKNDCGLYRNDGVLVLRNVQGQQIDRTRENTTEIFKDFLIDIKTNLKIVEIPFASYILHETKVPLE